MNILLEAVFDRAYNELVEEQYYPAENLKPLFQYFFFRYRKTFGEEHPPIKLSTMKRLIKNCEQIVLNMENYEYSNYIDAYFKHVYKNGCNYHIQHFLSSPRILQYLEYDLNAL